MSSLVDLTGQKFGRLVVLGRGTQKYKGNAFWRCQCDCGSVVDVASNHLRSGRVQSCGCLGRENSAKSHTTHGGSHTRLYGVWACMISRCYTPSNTSYQRYGAKGVKVCDEWRKDFAAFQNWAMSNGYDETAKRGECTIDRIDVYGNYEPNNCRWVSMSAQNKNKRQRCEK